MYAFRYAVVFGLLAALGSPAAGDFLTEQWGNAKTCRHRGTVTYKDRVVTFDLSAIPKGAKVYRAIFKPSVRRSGYSGTILFCPVLEQARDAEPKLSRPLKLRPPWYKSFDATAMVQTRVADPAKNLGLHVKWAPGVGAGNVVLEVSYQGNAAKPVPAVTGLKATHQAGQTFLTWKETEDVVGQDKPTFENFEKAVLGARTKRSIVYNVYRSDRPITVKTMGGAELVLTVPEVLPIWNLKALGVTEHANQGAPTKRSSLRPGYNVVRAQIVSRYRITDPGEPLPRATGLAAITVTKPGRRYYAVTAALDGAEALRSIRPVGPVDEKVSKFPAIIFQRSAGKLGKRTSRADLYNSWIGPPYHNVPTQGETCIIRWYDLPKADEKNRIPLWVFTGTYGSTTAGIGPGFINARKHVTGAFTIGLGEGGIWRGVHECIGTLRSYDQGVVHNYSQRRVLAAAAWGIWRKDFFVDPQRVYFWSQLGSWALRHGDVFAVVMSNGYGNLAIGKQAQKYAWAFGPGAQGSKNWLGIPQWKYVNLAKWIRENPKAELPYWLCWPAYGAYAAHTVGDFGFLPWPEMFHAMHSTKRAFAAVWNSNGPGAVGPLRSLVTRIRRDQSLPAFTNCNLDASPGDGDHADAEKSGGINLYQLWEPETIVDEPSRWEITLSLRSDCPADQLVTGLTPRRCQKFKAKPGEKFKWTNTSLADKKEVRSGTVTADKDGLVTLEKVTVTKGMNRIKITKQ